MSEEFSLVPRRDRPTLSGRIKNMKPRATLLLDGANPRSIQAICSRLGKASKPRREYATEKQNGGVRVWRLK